MGSMIRLIDMQGFQEATYEYDEFGRDLYNNQIEKLFGYVGYQRYGISQTYYAQAREYSAELGQFCSRDMHPGLGYLPKSTNEYGYCQLNPLKYIDLNGKWITTLIGGIVGGVAGAVGGIISEVTDDKPGIDWGNVAIDAGTGVVTGAVVGTFPLSAPALLGVGASAGAVNWGVKNTYHDEWGSKSIGEHIVDLGINVASWSLGTLIGGSVGAAELSASVFIQNFTVREVVEFGIYELLVNGTMTLTASLIGTLPVLGQNLYKNIVKLLENQKDSCDME